jgi:hypothetical protein
MSYRFGGVALLIVALGLFTTVQDAKATNVGGKWQVTLTQDSFFVDSCGLDFGVVGNALSVSGFCDFAGSVNLSGTADSTTGAFTASGSVDFDCTSVSLMGTVMSDGLTFTGTFDCPPNISSGTAAGTRCGNGVLDPGEVCDPSVSFNECCSSTCQPEPSGTACGDFSPPCRTDHCDSSANCVFVEAPNGTPCNDETQCTTGDSCQEGSCTPGQPITCDPCSTCEFFVGCVGQVSSNCRRPLATESLFQLQDRLNDANDRLMWTWEKGEATVPADFGNPRSQTGYALCAFDDFDHVVIHAQAPPGGVCAGNPCWQATSTGFRYHNPKPVGDDLRTLVLRAGSQGKARIAALGTGAGIGVPPLPLQPPVSLRVQVKSTDGTCWEALYDDPSVIQNNPLLFKGLGGPPLR